jgi:ATP:corrinoid adenosyltransferase
MTGRRDQAWIADLADTLTEVDEFLRSPAGTPR